MDLPGWPHPGLPFHAGELLAQERAGKRAQVESFGRRAVRGEMPEQHRLFFAQLPFLLAGAIDAHGMPWATVLAGTPGFVHAIDPVQLRIDANPLADDPLAEALRPGADVGLLGIELHTRRRNRLNGTIAGRDAAGLTVAVTQSFGNCPRYIQQRQFHRADAADAAAPVWRGEALDSAALDFVRQADTLFIATHHQHPGGAPTGGADVSHRGGKAGFIRVDDPRTLTFPDFNGNALFNTIGNLVANPRAGLVLVDFRDGTLLHIAGRTEVIWDGPEVAAYTGAERLVRIHVEQVLRRPGVLPLRWTFQAMSPVLEQTGSWQGLNG